MLKVMLKSRRQRGETEIGETQTAGLFERGELVMTLKVCRNSLLLPGSLTARPKK